MDLSALYRNRFPEKDLAVRRAVWNVLCERFFQQFVRPSDTVLDLGVGHGDFLRYIECGERIAVDTNPDVANYLPAEVRLVSSPSWDLGAVTSNSVDVVMASNFFEHLPTKERLLETLTELARVLRSSGRLMVLQPNLAYLHGRFFDFLDHHLPLTHLSMSEALSISGFVVRRCIPRFLPYTTRSSLPKAPWLVRLYLDVPPIWRVMGGQMFILAEKATSRDD